MNDKYMLISVCDREILTEKFETLELAQAAMHKEMIEQGKVPEEIFEDDSYEDCECGLAHIVRGLTMESIMPTLIG